MITSDKPILVGEITKPHGLKGFVKLRSFTHNPKDIFDFQKLYGKDFSKTYKINQKSAEKEGVFIVEVEGVSNKDEVESLRHTGLFIKRHQLPEAQENEFYHSDLEGLKVLTDKKKSGTILRILNFGAGEMLDIKWDDGTEETVPFTNDFVEEINLKEGFVRVVLPTYVEA